MAEKRCHSTIREKLELSEYKQQHPTVPYSELDWFLLILQNILTPLTLDFMQWEVPETHVLNTLNNACWCLLYLDH